MDSLVVDNVGVVAKRFVIIEVANLAVVVMEVANLVVVVVVDVRVEVVVED